jgi:alanine-synthesizing transaminase
MAAVGFPPAPDWRKGREAAIRRAIKSIPPVDEEFYRMKRLPPYVIAEVNGMRAAAPPVGTSSTWAWATPICRRPAT